MSTSLYDYLQSEYQKRVKEEEDEIEKAKKLFPKRYVFGVQQAQNVISHLTLDLRKQAGKRTIHLSLKVFDDNILVRGPFGGDWWNLGTWFWDARSIVINREGDKTVATAYGRLVTQQMNVVRNTLTEAWKQTHPNIPCSWDTPETFHIRLVCE